MTLISHRHSAYVDTDDLERAAGLIEQQINAETDIISNDETYFRYQGAAITLRLLCDYDFREPKDFMVVFARVMKDFEQESEN